MRGMPMEKIMQALSKEIAVAHDRIRIKNAGSIRWKRSTTRLMVTADLALAILFGIGIVLAGSDGGWWPWINLTGVALIGLVGLVSNLMDRKNF